MLAGFGARLLARVFGEILRRADARHHVFALRIDQPFAIISAFAGGRVAGEGHAGRAGLAHIAEHHRLHIDRGAPVARNVVEAAIDLGTI